jgi:phage I-like protein
MSNPIRLAVTLPEELGPAPERTKWIQIAYEGEFKGHASGEFEFDKAAFAQMLANFERYNAGTNTGAPVKYGHPRSDDAPAAGRILDLRTEPDPGKGRLRLMALVRFTPRAWEHVKGEEYYQCSVEVVPSYPDPVTGESVGTRLTGLGITNDPFLLGMKDLIAASTREPQSITLTARPQPAPRSTTFITSPEILIPGIRRR